MDGHGLICICTGCQRDILFQAEQTNYLEEQPLSPSAFFEAYDQLPKSTKMCSKCDAVTPPTSEDDPPVHTSSRKVHKNTSIAGVHKSVTITQKDRYGVLLKQLEETLSGDAGLPEDFKWKASEQLQDLKQLFENESIRQSADISSQKKLPLSPDHQSRQRKTQQRQIAKEQQVVKTFSCTSPGCKFSPTNSAMDWRRHEETHWRQKRYMCTQCPMILEKSLVPHCEFCMMDISEENPEALQAHYLQCDSARRNNRTFAREDKLSQHLQKQHSVPQRLAKLKARASTFPVESGWPRTCKFCGIEFEDWVC